MAIKEKPISRGSAEGRSNWYEAFEFLKAGQYEQAAEYLQTAIVTTNRTDDGFLVDILAAAHRICLVCSQCQAEVAWHRRAYKEANRREQELRRQVCAILDSIGGHQLTNKQVPRLDPFHTSTAELDPPESDTSKPVSRLTLWQRALNLLGRRPSPRSQEPKTYADSDATLAPSSSARSEIPAATLRDRVVVHILPSTEEAEGQGAIPGEEAAMLAASPVADEKQGGLGLPALTVYCLGLFRVFQDDKPVEEWLSSKGQSVFKYLVTHRQRPVAKEVLMELFWPGAHPDAARNNLNVAIYSLRQTLRKAQPDLSHILFLDDRYLLNPELQIWIDVEEFLERFKTAGTLERHGKQVMAIREYRAAEALYQGDFLEEDRYEEWILPQRQKLQDDYLKLLDRLGRYYVDQNDYDACLTVCSKMLAVDPCYEEAHRQLMRCYSWQGQPYLALRQYHLCAEALKQNLDVVPAQATVSLYSQIKKGMQIST